jgi:hypothetical protein
MTEPTQSEAHLVVAAIRVLIHRDGSAPRPDDIAELLQLPPAVLRVQLAALQDRGVVAIVESAFDTHVEIRNHLAIEDLAAAETDGALSEDLADFDRRKQAEAEKMEKLFSDGDHRRRQSERMDKMDAELQDFGKKKKPPRAAGKKDPLADLE